jgi:hypothetical protein
LSKRQWVKQQTAGDTGGYARTWVLRAVTRSRAARWGHDLLSDGTYFTADRSP